MKTAVRNAAIDALPSKEQTKLYVFAAVAVVLAGCVSAYAARKWNFARLLGYSSRECVAIANLSSIVVERLRENPERTIECPTSDGAASALFRSVVPAPTATVAGYYAFMVDFQKFFKDLLSKKCSGGLMTNAGLADAIEAAVVERCSYIA